MAPLPSDVLEQAVARGDVVGVAAFAADEEGVRFADARGTRTAAGDAMTTDAVFWLASMTKPVTSVAALQLVEQGRIGLDEPLGPRFPALARLQVLEGYDEQGRPRLRPARGAVTLRRLATHTAGFGYHYWDADLLRFYTEHDVLGPGQDPKRILEGPLLNDPGARWRYSVATDWIGQVIEQVAGQDLQSYLREHVLDPLGMTSTRFVLTADMRGRRAEVTAREPSGELGWIPFEPHQRPDFFRGGSGLYGTGPDYLRFTRALLRGGELDGARILRRATVDELWRNQLGALRVAPLRTALPAFSADVELLPGVPKTWGLAGLRNEAPTAEGRSAGSLAWAGLANTWFWIDRARRRTGVLLTQVLPFGDARVRALAERFEAAV